MVEKELIIVPPAVLTPEGKVNVPIDHNALQELLDIFGQLPGVQQDWLLTRFPVAETDEEATELVVRGGRTLSHSTVKGWKGKSAEFKRAYDLLSGRLIDWAKHLVMSIEAGNAIIAAMEKRRLLTKPWSELQAREATAKMQGIEASLDRTVGRKQEVDVNIIRVEDLIPKR